MAIQSRKTNSIKNATYGLLVTFFSVVVSFVNRTFLVKYLGVEPLGLNGLFTEVIAMMSLAELGVGMAIIYSLYKPIHENNYRKINQLMTLFKTTYNIIAIVIFLIGMAALPFIHLIVNGTSFPINYIRLVFFLFVVNASSSYLFSYNTSLINAYQKQYIVSLSTTLWKVFFTVVNIFLLYIFENYILYLVLLIVQTLCTNLYLANYVKKHYAYINYRDKLPKEEKQSIFNDIKNIFVKRVSGVVTSSSTNVLISIFVNTIQVGLYSNYVMIFSVVRTLKNQFSLSIKASIGDLSVSEESNKCIAILRQLTFMFFMFAIVVCSCLFSVANDFINIWLGSEFLMADTVVYVAIINLFIEILTEPLWQYLEVSGLFRQDKFIGIAGSALNLLVALILGYYIGIIGIFLGTIATQVLQMILKTKLLFSHKYNKSYSGYLFMQLKMVLVFVITSFLIYFLDRAINVDSIYLSFIIKSIISIMISLILGVFFFLGSQEEKDTSEFIRKLLYKNR